MEWKLVKADKETEHRFLNFYTLHYEVSTPSGKEDYSYFLASRREKEELLVYSDRLDKADGVMVLAVLEGKEPSLLMETVFRPALGKEVIEIPAGILDGGEDPVSGAKREMLEETGYALLEPRLLCPPSPTSSGLTDELVAIVYGKVGEKAHASLERFEDISSHFVPISSLPALLKDKEKLIALNVRLAVLYLLKEYGYGG